MASEEIIFEAFFCSYGHFLSCYPLTIPSGEEYNCEEDGVVYMYRKFPDKPYGYKDRKTETWQECQRLCSEMETCKGFTWHNEDTYEVEYRKGCSLFSTYEWRATGYWWSNTAISGLKECPRNAAGK